MVKSAFRVLKILEILASTHRGLRHAEIARSLSIPKGSLTLLLAELSSNGYVSHSGEEKRYVLGPQVLYLARRYLSGLDLVQMGQPILRDLTRTTGEASEIAVRRGLEILIVCKEDSSRGVLKSVIEIGNRQDMYSTAAGKAILAHLPDEEIDRYFASVELIAHTKHTITSEKTLRKELTAIRSGSLAYSREELNEGVIAMAVPAHDHDGAVAASIVTPMPSIRFNALKEKQIAMALHEAGERLSTRLGFKGEL